MVPADTYIKAGIMFCTTLANNDVARYCRLTAKYLDT